jgi:hypothetical protein
MSEMTRFQPKPDLPMPANRQLARALTRLQSSTALDLARTRSDIIRRAARVEAEAIVATVKVQEINRVTKEAIGGCAMLRHYADTVAHGDPMLMDELRFFTDVARLGAGEVIADMVTSYCREGRGL